MRNILGAGLLMGFATVAGACSSARASAPIERPPLEVPPPPPRVIVALPPPDAAPILAPVDELPTPSGERPARPRPSRPRPDPDKPQDPKVEPPVEAVQPPQTTAPPPQLRLENPNHVQLSAQVRDTIGRARGLLAKLDRNNLGTEPRRKAFDDAQLFAQQAEDALKQNNLVFAKELADKAERFARELQNR